MQQRPQQTAFKGELRLTKVCGTKLAAEDTLTSSSDPYFVIMYKTESLHLEDIY